MGSFRLRFTPDEHRAFTIGTKVEWLNATRWCTGVIEGPAEFDSGAGANPRQQVMPVRSTSASGIVRSGEVIRVLPKHVRIPQE